MGKYWICHFGFRKTWPVAYHRIRFIFGLLRLNLRILYNLYYFYFANYCRSDDCLVFTLHTLSDATYTCVVYGQFVVITQGWRDIYVDIIILECYCFFFVVVCLRMASKRVYYNSVWDLHTHNKEYNIFFVVCLRMASKRVYYNSVWDSHTHNKEYNIIR